MAPCYDFRGLLVGVFFFLKSSYKIKGKVYIEDIFTIDPNRIKNKKNIKNAFKHQV